MIKKIYKTIIILSICLGITIPSNAAISVSDGSAFMTKTEFMADINNLSSRVSQLEITMDGTLDNKVNAYLEQKGFWKAKVQNIINANMTNVRPYAITNTSGNVKANRRLQTQVLVNELSSSGMCLLNIAYVANNASCPRWGYLGLTSTSTYYQSSIMLILNFYEEIGSNQTHRASIVLGQGIGQMRVDESSTSNYVNAILLPPVEILTPTMFFVNKGSRLRWTLDETYGLYSLNGAPTNSTNLSGINIRVVECIVY